MGSLKVKQTIK